MMEAARALRLTGQRVWHAGVAIEGRGLSREIEEGLGSALSPMKDFVSR